MDKKSKLDSSAAQRFYVRLQEKKIKRIENAVIKYEHEIQTAKEEILKERSVLNSEIVLNDQLSSRVEELLKHIHESGIIFNIENPDHKVQEWENVKLVKRGACLRIQTKEGIPLKDFDSDKSKIIEEVLSAYPSYSLVVIRVDKKYMKIQLRFH